MFRFNPNRLQLKNELGKGRFGKVFPYQKDPEDSKWVVKRIKAGDADELVASLPEFVLGFACDHPCVVPVKGYFIEKNPDQEGYNLYMKLPRMKGTLLNDFKGRKSSNRPYSEEEIIRRFYSLVCGVEHLHSKKIYHRDIKPDNLLLDEQGNLKVGDVGIAKHVEDKDSYQTMTGDKGTYQYSAPEIFNKKVTKDLLAKADSWSIGIVILELCLFEVRVFNCLLTRDERQDKLKELFKRLEEREYHRSLTILLQRMLSLDPKNRLDVGQIKAELERNFSDILDKEVQNLENPRIVHVDNEPEIAVQHIKEICEKYETETNQLKETISQLKMDLVDQKKQHEQRIQALVGQNNSKAREEYAQQQAHQNGLEETSDSLKDFEGQIKNLQQENIQLDEEKSQLLKDLDDLKIKLNELENPQVELIEEGDKKNFDEKLYKVIWGLNAKWNTRFQFQEIEKKLRITYKMNNFTDKNVSEMSKDVIAKLDENKPPSLLGYIIDFQNCKCFTSQTFSNLAEAISSQTIPLKHLTLDFRNTELGNQTFKEFPTVISSQSLYLESLTLNFGKCTSLTDQMIVDLSIALSSPSIHLQYLALDCSSCNNLTDRALEYLTMVVSNPYHRLQYLSLTLES